MAIEEGLYIYTHTYYKNHGDWIEIVRLGQMVAVAQLVSGFVESVMVLSKKSFEIEVVAKPCNE